MRHFKASRYIRASLLLALPAVVLSSTFQNDQQTPREKRGKQVYQSGVSPSGQEITAALGNSDVETPASVLSCVNCHGRDGRGKPEGGVRPSNITWEALTRPYDVTLPSGRKHPPYTEASLKRAITMGLDPAGNRLNVAMPRYRISQQDIADLIAYLKRLGAGFESGLTATTMRIGTVLPPAGRLNEMSRSVRSVLTAYFDEVNQEGGIYGRRIDLRFVEPPDGTQDRARAISAFIESEQIFALVGSFMAGADKEVASVIQEQEVPLVGAFTLYPQIGFPLNRYIFYLHSGIKEQARVLAGFAAQNYPKTKRAAILCSEEANSREAAEAVKDSCRESGWASIDELVVAPGLTISPSSVQKLKDKGAEVIFLFGPSGSDRVFTEEATKLDWNPLLLLPGSLASSDLFGAPESFDRRVFMSFPTLPSEQTAEALARYRKSAQSAQTENLASQATALASAMVLVEGLKRVGRDLSREKLITALDGFYEFRTGLAPAVTFGPNRRVGAMGAYVVAVDLRAKTLVRGGEWIDIK